MKYRCAILFISLLAIVLCAPKGRATGPLKPQPLQPLEAEVPQSVHIPDWVTDIPTHCFVGISGLCRSIDEAREQALSSVISQILQAMGAEYSLKHRSQLSGTIHASHHELKEKLTYTATWFIRSIQQHIKQSDIQWVHGRYICFILVEFPPEEIEHLRKLSIGPKLVARIARKDGKWITIVVRETNGVEVTLTDYRITTTIENRHADIVTLFACKVPKDSRKTYEGAIDHPVSIKESSQRLSIPNFSSAFNLKSFLLGAQSRTEITIQGYDERGQKVTVKVTTP
jgi:hypothetical protein